MRIPPIFIHQTPAKSPEREEWSLEIKRKRAKPTGTSKFRIQNLGSNAAFIGVRWSPAAAQVCVLGYQWMEVHEHRRCVVS